MENNHPCVPLWTQTISVRNHHARLRRARAFALIFFPVAQVRSWHGAEHCVLRIMGFLTQSAPCLRRTALNLLWIGGMISDPLVCTLSGAHLPTSDVIAARRLVLN